MPQPIWAQEPGAAKGRSPLDHLGPPAHEMIAAAKAAASPGLDMSWQYAAEPVRNIWSTTPAAHTVWRCSHGTLTWKPAWMHCRTVPGATSCW